MTTTRELAEALSSVMGDVQETFEKVGDRFERDSTRMAALESEIARLKQEMARSYIPNHTEVRRKLWRDVAIAVAASSNAQQKSSMHGWADYALAEFDKRFPAY